MSLADYATRKYDFLALQNPDALKERQLDMQLFSARTGGQICVGAQKLAQRLTLEFLTEIGSMPGRPNRGCNFMTRVRRGRIRTRLDIVQAFYAAALRIRTTLQAEEYVDMPPDEKLDDVELVAVTFLPGYLSLKVNILSVAGNSRPLILPIETLP
jgi:hypothetical protein